MKRSLSPSLCVSQPFGQQLLLAAENDLSKGILMTLRATTAAAPPRRAYLPSFYMTTVRPHFSLRRSGGFSHPISSSLLSALLSSAPCEEEGEIFLAPLLPSFLRKKEPICPIFCPLLISTDNICNLQGGKVNIISSFCTFKLPFSLWRTISNFLEQLEQPPL